MGKEETEELPECPIYHGLGIRGGTARLREKIADVLVGESRCEGPWCWTQTVRVSDSRTARVAAVAKSNTVNPCRPTASSSLRYFFDHPPCFLQYEDKRLSCYHPCRPYVLGYDLNRVDPRLEDAFTPEEWEILKSSVAED